MVFEGLSEKRAPQRPQKAKPSGTSAPQVEQMRSAAFRA
jgi:hypothetical protein